METIPTYPSNSEAVDVFFLLHEQYRDFREEPGYTEIVRTFEHSGRLGQRQEYVFQRTARQFMANPANFIKNCIKQRCLSIAEALGGETLEVYPETSPALLKLLEISGITTANRGHGSGHVLLPGTLTREAPPSDLTKDVHPHLFIEDFFLRPQVEAKISFLDMLETHILWCVHFSQPDLLVWAPTYVSEKPENPRPQFLQYLRNFSPRTGSFIQWWDYDERDSSFATFEKQCLKWADMVNIHDCYTRFQRIKNKEGIYSEYPDPSSLHWHPTVFDPGLYRRMDLDKEYDVAIFGSAENERVKFINFLHEEFGERFRHFGSLQDGQRHIPTSEYVRCINQTKIFVNTQTFKHRIQFKGKVREAMSCGAFILEEANPETCNFAPEGTGYVFFQDMEDLKEKIDYYLTNSEERLAIAEKGHSWFHEHHNARRWVDTIIANTRNS